MIRIYRFGGYPQNNIIEGQAERETDKFWIIDGRRESKEPGNYHYLDYTWFRTPQEAVQTYIDRQNKLIDGLESRLSKKEEELDHAISVLKKLKGEPK